VVVRSCSICDAISSRANVAGNVSMLCAENKCILWVGDKHAGKTTAAIKLIVCLQHQGYTAGGILAPSIYQDDQLIGFDIVDIQNDVRVPLAVRDEKSLETVPYKYNKEGLELGYAALSPAENEAADLVIVDEYGPLELDGKGWRGDTDRLLEQSYPPVFLVVRREVADKVRGLYEKHEPLLLEAMNPESIDRVLAFVLDQRSKWGIQ